MHLYIWCTKWNETLPHSEDAALAVFEENSFALPKKDQQQLRSPNQNNTEDGIKATGSANCWENGSSVQENNFYWSLVFPQLFIMLTYMMMY